MSKAAAPVNLKEQNAAHIFCITIRNVEHFYKLIHWLNSNVGKGSDKWTMEGKGLLRNLRQGKVISPKVYIFKHDFDVESAMFLNLL